ncbi:MAG TPA: 5'-nucleotidase C-terminal domain-containing protein [Pyrinomonadaceae bacterium]|jgi:2',3'-cyclic-nucleotide 2'-phosphodiesterase (5'-nucleotidase family)|nr:5'-nucleotidase C-terminal domain-containing protein [Pyrinomonadaceae bacterium]
MTNFTRKRARGVSSYGLLLFAVLCLGAIPGFSQPAAKTQSTPAPTGGADVHARVNQTVIDSSIPDDLAVDQMVAVYAPKVREIENVIGKLKGELRKGGIGAGSLGNFVTDGILFEARRKLGPSVALAVTNAGGLRGKSTIPEGDLRQKDIWELLPFENALVEFDLTGAQVVTLLKQVVSHRDAQAGARIKYVNDADNKPQFESARLLVDGKEQEIDEAATYKVICIDYLWKRTGNGSETEGNYSVLGHAQKIEPLGLTIRDAIIDYVEKETAAGREIKPNLDGRFSLDRNSTTGQKEMLQ